VIQDFILNYIRIDCELSIPETLIFKKTTN
jgi:hypothetical protein